MFYVCVLLNCRENKPKNGGICVANHTTPIDVIILANDGCYSLVEHLVVFCDCASGYVCLQPLPVERQIRVVVAELDLSLRSDRSTVG